jgi:hypothetical protein
MMTNLEWCCTAFKGWWRNAGGRGTSVLMYRSRGRSWFVLQFRAIDADVTERLPPTTFPISTVTDIAIAFCPWCGAELVEKYEMHLDELARPDLAVDALK